MAIKPKSKNSTPPAKKVSQKTAKQTGKTVYNSYGVTRDAKTGKTIVSKNRGTAATPDRLPPNTSLRAKPIEMAPKITPKDKRVIVANANLAKEDLTKKKSFLSEAEKSLYQQQLSNAQSQLQTIQQRVNQRKIDEEKQVRADELALRNKEIDAKTSLAKGVIGAEADTESKLPPGWDEETYRNFKAANPDLEPDAQDTANMLGATDNPFDQRLADADYNLQRIDEEMDNNYEKLKSDTDKIINGTFPLNQYERTMVDALKKNLDSLKEEQRLANKNYEGGVTQSGIMQGLDRYSPVMAQGRIFQAVSDGIQKIERIEIEGAKALAELKQGFADKKYEQITGSYDRLDKLLKDKKEAIQKVHDDIQKERDDLATANAEKLKDFSDFQEELAKTASGNGASPDVIAGILASENKLGAYNAAQGYLQNATGAVGEYQFYAKQERAAGRTPMSFLSFQHYTPPEDGGGLLSKADKEVLAFDKAFGEEFQKTEEYQQYATTKNAWGRIQDVTGGSNDLAELAKLADTDAQTIVDALTRIQKPDIARGADGGSQVDVTAFSKLYEANYAKYVKDNQVIPSKLLEAINTADKIQKGAQKRAVEAGNEIKKRTKTQYGREAIIPDIEGDKAFNAVVEEDAAEGRINNYIDENPDQAQAIATLLSKPSPAFDNKPPTYLQAYEYLKTKGKIK